MTTTASGDRRTVRDIYRLTPMQEGMLFHTLSAPGAPLYLQQYVIDVTGADRDDLAYACDELIRRHDVLRTGFVWEGIDRPVQIVFASAPSPLTIAPRDMACDVDAWVESTLAAQRERSFDIRRPPLLAMHALEIGTRHWRIVVTHHHLILDGWSVPILHDELVRLMRGRHDGGPVIGSPQPFREFVALIAARDDDEGNRRREDGDYWAETVGDVAAPTPLAVDRVGRVTPPDAAGGFGRIVTLRSVDEVGDLAETCRRFGLLPSTVVHAAWGLLLCRYNDVVDATFGLTLSGRSADLVDADSRVGMFVNSLPLRVRCADDMPILEWLRCVQQDLSHIHAREHASLADVTRRSAVPPGRPLYETVVAFQNYWRAGLDDHGDDSTVRLRVVATRERTSVPVAIAVALPAEGVWVRLDYDDARLDQAAAAAMASHYLDLVRAIVRALAAGSETTVGGLRLTTDDASEPATQPSDLVEDIARELSEVVGVTAGDRVRVVEPIRDVEPDVLRRAASTIGLSVVDADDGDVEIVIGSSRLIDVAWTPARVRVFVDDGPTTVPMSAETSDPRVSAYRLFCAGGRASITRLHAPVDGGRVGARRWMRIVDRHSHRCVAGVVGELLIDGNGGPSPTGLSARVRADGDIEIMGTVGNERDWVARTIAAHPDVADAIVVEDTDGRSTVWLVPSDIPLSRDAVATYLNRLVPPDLQPTDIEFIDRLPLNHDGTINREALAGDVVTLPTRGPTPLRDRLDAVPDERRTRFLDNLRQRAAPGPRRRGGDRAPVSSFAQEQWTLTRAAALRDRAEATIALSAPPASDVLDAAVREVARLRELSMTPDVTCSTVDGGPTMTVRVDPTIADGRAAQLLARDIAAVLVGDRRESDAHNRLRYVDYAAWQTDPRRADECAAQLESWRTRLDGSPPLGIVPERVPKGAAGIAEHRMRVPAESTTTAATWTVAVAAAVAGLGRVDDVVIGAVIRPNLAESLADVVGAFARLLPVRLMFDASTTIGQMRAQATEELARVAECADVSWRDIEAMLAEPLLAAVSVGPLGVREPIAGVSLAVEVDGAEVVVRYDATRWHPTSVAALTTRIVALAHAPDDDALVSRGGVATRRDVDDIDDDMRQHVLGWGDGGVATETDRPTLPEIVARVAARTPNAVAVDGPDGVMTYAELIARANVLAAWLRHRGIVIEDRVALCVPRSTAMVWAALGIVMTGAAYVPVDAHWPEERRTHVLADAKVRAVVTVREWRNLFEKLDLVGSVDSGEIASEPTSNAPVGLTHGPTDRDLNDRCGAYAIYTSGSTGTPKGVLVEHRSVVNFVRHIAEAYAIDASTRLLGFAPMTFDISVFDIWTALGCGATLVLAGDFERQSADALQTLLRDKRVTAAELPPSLMPLLSPAELPDLRLVSVGGEAPAAPLADIWVTGNREMWNGYGPTETTVAVTLMRCESPSGGRVPPIGRPMPNHRAYVVDDNLRLVPPGVPGELCIAGLGLARGYVGQPGATAARFVPEPFSGLDGARMYRTGDLVRWTGDGLLEFLGRADRQVKVRGFRIELSEVESGLNRDERIRQAVVDAHDDSSGTRHLVAYVVPADGASIDLAVVRDIAAERLPDYMLPTRVVVLNELPMTSHGKLDRRALAALVPAAAVGARSAGRGIEAERTAAAAATATEAGTPTEASTPTQAATPTEQAIVADIFTPLLGVADVSVDDDFFRLGGSSLQAMQVTSRVRDRFTVEVSLADFFVQPTARRLAQLVDAAVLRRNQEHTDLYDSRQAPVAPTADPDRPTGLAYPQLRMWQMNELEPGHPSHHAPLALRLTGSVDVDAIRSAINTIVARHAPLRSRFSALEQTFAAHEDVPVEIVDANGDDVARLVREESERPFDLVHGPMLRVRLYRLRDDEHVLQWNVHHIVTDGWSIGVMLGELFALYNAHRSGREPDLPALPTHYREFVEWQRGFVVSPEYGDQLAWWQSRLSGLRPDLGLPTEMPRGNAFRIGWRNIRLSQQEAQAAADIGRRHGVTLFMVTLACWSMALGADADWDELAVVVPLAGRKRSEWEPLVGYFVNRVLVRVPLRPDLTFGALLERLRTEVAEAFAHQDVPFENLIHELALPTSAVTVNFSIQNAPQSKVGLNGLRIGPVIDDTGRDFTPIMELYSPVGTRFEASMMLRERGDGIAGGLEYNASLFSDEDASRWAQRFGTLLVTAAADSGMTLGALLDVARHSNVSTMG